MEVYVVMSNDFPHKVFSSEEKAETYCLEANEADRQRVETAGYAARIYYRSYEFTVE